MNASVVMELHDFRGDLSNISAETKPLALCSSWLRSRWLQRWPCTRTTQSARPRQGSFRSWRLGYNNATTRTLQTESVFSSTSTNSSSSYKGESSAHLLHIPSSDAGLADISVRSPQKIITFLMKKKRFFWVLVFYKYFTLVSRQIHCSHGQVGMALSNTQCTQLSSSMAITQRFCSQNNIHNFWVALIL